MLKRKLKQVEDAELFADLGSANEGEGDSMEESSTSEEEMEELEIKGENNAQSKIRVLLIASRGINARQRHAMQDLSLLLPHAKKESKYDTKRDLFALNELAELHDCSHVLYFESRKPQELFLWLAQSPNGPSARFHVQNMHTMDELHFEGNCMRHTRPLLVFDPVGFPEEGPKAALRPLLERIFGVPARHRRTRPHIDHVLLFSWLDDRIWMRNYQMVPTADAATSTTAALPLVQLEGMSLREIGPRLVLRPVRILEGSFSGRTLWQNEHFVSAGTLRAAARSDEAMKHQQRAQAHDASVTRKRQVKLPDNELDHIFE